MTVTVFFLKKFQYPWSAAIIRADNETHHVIHCHGSLISNDIVLSAAHCYKSNDTNSKLYVVLGSVEPFKQGTRAVARYNRKRKIKPIQEIKEVFLHKAYKIWGKEAYHDVSLTRLKEPVKFNKFMHPLCLPLNPVVQNVDKETERSIQSQKVIVTGYVTGMIIQFPEFYLYGAVHKLR